MRALTHTHAHTHTHALSLTHKNNPPPWKAYPYHPPTLALWTAHEKPNLSNGEINKTNKNTQDERRETIKKEVSLVDCSIPPLRCISFFFFSSYYFICLLPGHSLHFLLLIVVVVCVFQILVILKWFRLVLWSHLESERSQSFGSYFD